MNINNYFKYFDKLNYDLQNEILSKIRKSQNKDLLEDITNFKKAKKEIFEKYENNNCNYDINSESFIYFQIESDLIKYFNDDITTLYGITETNVKKLERILSIKLKMKKNKALIATKMMIDNKISVNKRINMLIGALTIKERQNFIDKLNTHYFI
tara:strand:+ start:3135 stop:3599 length:465 start_codon:yes stop_codon:yes gene_type:complete